MYPNLVGPSSLADRCAISPKPPSDPESPPFQATEATTPKSSGTKKLGSFFHTGSIKKKAPNAPAKKPTSDTESSSHSNNFSSPNQQALAARAGRLFTHARTTSDTTALMQTVSQWKNISAELENSFRNENPNHKHKTLIGSSSSPYSPVQPSAQRPHCPAPPLPVHHKPKLPQFLAAHLQSSPLFNSPRVSNGQSIENISSKPTDSPLNREFPIPPPRKVSCLLFKSSTLTLFFLLFSSG